MTATAPTVASLMKTAPKITIPETTQRLVLTGFMGAGKSSIGRLLAQALAWDFLDLDQHLESRTQSTIPHLFATLGEPAFRRLESSALANALARPHTVIALGGGTPEQLTNRLLLEQTPATTVIFLDAPFPVLFDRCMLQTIASPFSDPAHIRPLLASPEEAQTRFTTRLPLYRRLARITLPTETLTPGSATESILNLLR